MVKRYTRLIVLLLAGSTSTTSEAQTIAPSIVNSGGSSVTAGGYTWELNFGELMAISTAAAPNITVTQGLLQPITGSTILPVTLIRFQGVKMNRYNQLSWATGHESGSTQFELQRSDDARNFTTIHTTAARGLSNGSNYSYNDYQPVPCVPSSSRILPVTCNFASGLQIVVLYDYEKSYWTAYPNPVLHGNQLQVTLQNADAATSVILTLTDASGRKVLEQKETLATGFQIISLPVRVPPGLYTLSVTGFNKNSSQKIIVN